MKKKYITQDNKLFRVLMNCHHESMFYPIPKVGDILYCYRCNDYRVCVQVSQMWRMMCRTCQVNREYGLDEHRVRRMAVRHLRLSPGHQVYVVYGDHRELVQDHQQRLPIVTET